MLEGQFNLNIVKSILEIGIFSYKVIDKVHPGIPDIYVAGGTWIEGKIIRTKGRRGANWLGKYTTPQINICNSLIGSGDFVLAASMWEFPEASFFVIIPFSELIDRPVWSGSDIRAIGKITKKGQYPLRHIFEFSQHHDDVWTRNINEDWYYA